MPNQEYTFRVNLQNDRETLLKQEELATFANLKALYLPLEGGGLPVKKLRHNETFTVSGIMGARLKRLIEQGRITNVVLDTAVEDEESAEEEESLLTMYLVRRDGIYSMTLNNDRLSVGGRIYKIEDEFVPGTDRQNAGQVMAASDGQNNYVIMNNYDGDFSFFKVEPDGTTTNIGIPDLVDDTDTDQIYSMIYIGDNKLAMISDGSYIVFTTSGELLLNYFNFSYESFQQIVYFEGAVYGVGNNQCLYAVNKDTGEVFGDGDIEVKESRTLSWKDSSPYQYPIQFIYDPFVIDGRFFAIAWPNEGDDLGWNDRLIEIFPNTNEILHIALADANADQINSLNFVADRSTETGFSVANIDDFEATYLEREIAQYDGEMWVDSSIFYKDPTMENIILQKANYQAFEEDQDIEWQDVTITSIVYDESDNQWDFTFTGYDNSGNDDIMRMRYTDGSGDFWTYIEID